LRLLLIIFISLLSTSTYAAGGGEGIPWSMITAQVVNVVLAIIILTWLLKDKVRALFVGRVEKFDEEFKRAQDQKNEAIKKRDTIKQKLEGLKVNAEKSIQDAKENAQQNTLKTIENANEQAKKILLDSESKVLNEKNKLVGELKKDLLKKSFAKARSGLSDNMSEVELKKLKEEFIKNIQAVQ